jgi:hypothetical protein
MIILRAVWAVLMLIFLLLIIDNSISGFGTVIYSLVVLAVMAAEMYLRHRLQAGPRAAR